MNEIKVEPESIVFIDRNNKSGKIILKNISMEGKAFKIKTTKPKDYVVKPNMGIIIPMQQIDIDVQMSGVNTPDHTHKFMIEIYKYDWRGDVTSLKNRLKSKDIVPLHTYKLEIAYQLEEFKDTEGLCNRLPISNSYLYKSCWAVVAVLGVFLFMKIFKSDDL